MSGVTRYSNGGFGDEGAEGDPTTAAGAATAGAGPPTRSSVEDIMVVGIVGVAAGDEQESNAIIDFDTATATATPFLAAAAFMAVAVLFEDKKSSSSTPSPS